MQRTHAWQNAGWQAKNACLRTETLIDHHFMAFVLFLLVNPEVPFVMSLVIQKMTNPQLQQIRNA
jgi:hypothetical protein